MSLFSYQLPFVLAAIRTMLEWDLWKNFSAGKSKQVEIYMWNSLFSTGMNFFSMIYPSAIWTWNFLKTSSIYPCHMLAQVHKSSVSIVLEVPMYFFILSVFSCVRSNISHIRRQTCLQWEGMYPAKSHDHPQVDVSPSRVRRGWETSVDKRSCLISCVHKGR